MLTIYAQAAADARPRPSDRVLDTTGERLQFIGTRAAKKSAFALAQRESLRVNGVACVLDTMGWQIIAMYSRGEFVEKAHALTMPPETVREAAAAAQQREHETTGVVRTTGFESIDDAMAEDARKAQEKLTGPRPEARVPFVEVDREECLGDDSIRLSRSIRVF